MSQRLPYASIVVTQTDIEPYDQEFLKEWANNLHLPVGKLLKRIMLAALSGESYEDEMPEKRSVKTKPKPAR